MALVKKREWLRIMSLKISYSKGYLLIGLFIGVLHWFAYNWANPLIASVFTLWIVLCYAFVSGIIGYLLEIRLNKDEKLQLKSPLKEKGLEFEILNPIAPESLTSVIHRLYREIEFYFDKTRSEYPIKYFPQRKTFKIDYNGTLKSKEQILKIIIKKFKDEFLIKSII